MDNSANPFAVLSLIVAPAILTNACSVLVMSTSNRLARAVYRAREMARQLEDTSHHPAIGEPHPREELAAAETRALLLLQALQSFYTALSGFAAAALVSLVGAVLASVGQVLTVRLLEVVAVLTGAVAVGALIHGCTALLRETRLAVQVLRDRAAALRLKHPAA